MNLIEKFGIEKCRQIVRGAPDGAQLCKTHFNLVGYVKLESHFVYMAVTTWKCGFDGKPNWKIMGCRSILKFKPKKFYRLADLRTAIDEHDQYWYGQSEEKELKQYALLSQEKIEGGVMLVGDFKNNLTSSEYKNCFQAERMRTVVNIGTVIANNGAPTNDGADNFSHFDHCSDIRNHISPNTVVIER